MNQYSSNQEKLNYNVNPSQIDFFNVNIYAYPFSLNKMERKVTITFTSPLHMHVLDTTMAHFFPLKY